MAQISGSNTSVALTNPWLRATQEPSSFRHRIPSLTYYRTITTDALPYPRRRPDRQQIDAGRKPQIATVPYNGTQMPWWAVPSSPWYYSYGGPTWQYWLPFMVGMDVGSWMGGGWYGGGFGGGYGYDDGGSSWNDGSPQIDSGTMDPSSDQGAGAFGGWDSGGSGGTDSDGGWDAGGGGGWDSGGDGGGWDSGGGGGDSGGGW